MNLLIVNNSNLGHIFSRFRDIATKISDIAVVTHLGAPLEPITRELPAKFGSETLESWALKLHASPHSTSLAQRRKKIADFIHLMTLQ